VSEATFDQFRRGGAVDRLDERVPPDIIDHAITAMLVVFIFFFFTGSKLTGFPIPVRIEDLIFVMLVPMSYRYMKRTPTPLFFWIAFYFAINLIPYFAWAVTGDYRLSFYPVIMVKEMEYFYIAYLICVNRSRWLMHAMDGLAVLLIAYGMRELARGNISYYGIGSLGTTQSPSLAGALYLFSTIWLHVRSKLVDRRWLRAFVWLMIVSGAICAVFTVSRSTIIALFLYVSVYLFLTNVALIPFFLTAAGMFGLFVKSIADAQGAGIRFMAARIIARLGLIGEAGETRSTKWQIYLGEFDAPDFIFGRGKGYPNARDKTIAMGVDSQPVRTIMENGFVGVAVLGGILSYALLEIYRKGGEFEHAAGTMAAMLIMSLPLEAFQVSKSGGYFWLLIFYFLMCQRKKDPNPPQLQTT
jgi:hypothetical protein